MTDAMDEKREWTRPLWEGKYPDHPFNLPQDRDKVLRLLKRQSRTSLRYDVVAASCRQMSFFYNVSLPHYRKEDFLAKSAKRYYKFLALKKIVGKLFIVPCYDIDLIWHTHQGKQRYFAVTLGVGICCWLNVLWRSKGPFRRSA